MTTQNDTYTRRIRRSAGLILAAMIFLMLPACDSAGPDMGPGPGPDPGPNPGPTMTSLTIDFSRIEVIRDCDGIEGDGDFSFGVTATTSTGQTHTAYTGSRTMGDGDVFSSLDDVTFELPATEGQQVTVSFAASEIDQNIFGAVFPDDRMNNRIDTGTHLFNSGTWSGTGALTLTNGGGDCEVRLYYAALPA